MGKSCKWCSIEILREDFKSQQSYERAYFCSPRCRGIWTSVYRSNCSHIEVDKETQIVLSKSNHIHLDIEDNFEYPDIVIISEWPDGVYYTDDPIASQKESKMSCLLPPVNYSAWSSPLSMVVGGDDD
jgi:hypothetical protein